MSTPILISGGEESKRLEEVSKIIGQKLGVGVAGFHPDLLLITGEKSLTIKQVRETTRWLSFSPHIAKTKIAVFLQAEKLTIPAQNALLKTLEEPPGKSLIILACANKNLLLPTIVSRCSEKFVTAPPPAAENEMIALIEKLSLAKPGKRLQIMETALKTSGGALALTEKLLSGWRSFLLGKRELGIQKKEIVEAIKKTASAREDLLANVNPYLVLGNLFLDYPQSAPLSNKKIAQNSAGENKNKPGI